MQRRAVIAAAAWLGVACTPARAQPASAEPAPAEMPATWTALPALAAAMAEGAKADGVAIDHAGAWGDAARGCYAVRLGLSGGDAPPATIAGQVVDALAGARAGSAGDRSPLTFSELVKPADGGDVVSFAFARAPYHGKARLRLAAGRITALACFGNQRDPARCDAACGRMLQSPP